MKGRLKVPSPAFVVSLVALFVALGGTSLAASKVIAAKHKDAKADTKLIKKLAPKLSVKHAKTANSAATATNATHATSADSATSATNATHATSADSATNATNASQLGGVPDTGYALAGRPFVVQNLNGVGSEGGCASGTLAVEVLDGRYNPVDARFTLMVGTSPITYAQIRANATIRSSSSNVTSVAHTLGSGIYCVGFTTTLPNQDQIESAVLGLGTN